MANAENCGIVLDNILAHPEKHDQNSFGKKTSCGTTMCIAGWAVELFAPEKIVWVSSIPVVAHGEEPEEFEYLQDSRRDFDIETEAAEILGLTVDEAYDLFFTYDNQDALEKLRLYAER